LKKAAPGAAFFASRPLLRNVSEVENGTTPLGFFDDDYWLSHEEYLTAEQADFDVAEIIGLLGRTSGRLLDAPCGTGRLAGRLALLGFDVDGVDLDPRALELARSQQRGFERPVRYFQRDLRQLHHLGSYDVVLSWFNSFGYFTTSENLALLETYASLLQPGGVVLINTLDLDAVVGVLDDGPLEEDFDVEGRNLSLISTLEGNRLVTTRIGGGVGPETLQRSSVELFTAGQWRTLLRNCGLHDVDVLPRSAPSFGDPIAEVTVRGFC